MCQGQIYCSPCFSGDMGVGLILTREGAALECSQVTELYGGCLGYHNNWVRGFNPAQLFDFLVVSQT